MVPASMRKSVPMAMSKFYSYSMSTYSMNPLFISP
jgi:hypothetical protein